MMPTAAEITAAARQGFESAFAEKRFYDRQTSDDVHLKAILDFLPVRPRMKILDLGAGTGYLTFALAKRYPGSSVTGADIAANTLGKNRERAAAENIGNISFAECDGITLPFADGETDMVVSRYAFHHFPDIRKTLLEISRVLSDKGYLFISDPSPNENDTVGFIDEYMRVKPDGHIKFRSYDEWLRLCDMNGFDLVGKFVSSIRFPRKFEKIYTEIMERYDPGIVGGYEPEMIGDEIYVTERVNNILFRKR